MYLSTSSYYFKCTLFVFASCKRCRSCSLSKQLFLLCLLDSSGATDQERKDEGVKRKGLGKDGWRMSKGEKKGGTTELIR